MKFIGVPSLIIQELIPKNNNADINIGLCLHENRSFCFDLSKEIFKAVQKYISDNLNLLYLEQISIKWLFSSNGHFWTVSIIR
jgi:hypothetical protein